MGYLHVAYVLHKPGQNVSYHTICLHVCMEAALTTPSRWGDFLCFIAKIACFLKYIRNIFLIPLKQERNIRARKTIVR